MYFRNNCCSIHTLRGLIIFGNAVLLLCGLALMAVGIWVTTDPDKLYPYLETSGNSAIFIAAWIALFCGFAFFIVGCLGIHAAWTMRRSRMLAYIILTLIIFVFEAASCIIALAHQHYILSHSEKHLEQMLSQYGDDDRGTNMWDEMMKQQQCCGVNGPTDWLTYTSKFSIKNNFNDSSHPWPNNCCKRNNNDEFSSISRCMQGDLNHLNDNGCYHAYKATIQKYILPLAWLGFAILLWAFWVVAASICLYPYC
uniref:uroplakin-1a-like isoform X1 n=2 Tax=Myxine glutinosa TaxID=7769 RepID=UPI0035902646